MYFIQLRLNKITQKIQNYKEQISLTNSRKHFEDLLKYLRIFFYCKLSIIYF